MTTIIATPHPEIANGELWRSTDPLLPIASRTRTIISWATQRDRTRLFDGKQGLSEAERVAKEAIDGFIEGICDLSIDTSVPFRQVSFFLSSLGWISRRELITSCARTGSETGSGSVTTPSSEPREYGKESRVADRVWSVSLKSLLVERISILTCTCFQYRTRARLSTSDFGYLLRTVDTESYCS